MVTATAPGVVCRCAHYKVRKCQLLVGRQDSDLSKITICMSSEPEVGVASVSRLFTMIEGVSPPFKHYGDRKMSLMLKTKNSMGLY